MSLDAAVPSADAVAQVLAALAEQRLVGLE